MNGEAMPKLSVNGISQDVSEQRLVLAIKDSGVNIGHRCGGQARCTTCRVEFITGEPTTMTQAEYNKLKEKELLGQFRLSCQVICNQDMEITAPMLLENQTWTDTGPQPDTQVQPEAKWLSKTELEL
jgi:ferredoxin